MLTGPEARQNFRQAVKDAFTEVIRKRRGDLERAGLEIGSSRQALQQYADGGVPGADVLLTALLMWQMVVQINDPSARAGETKGWECSIKTRLSPVKAARTQPMQLPLFQAIDDLGEQDLELKIVRKGTRSIELGLEISFPKRAM